MDVFSLMLRETLTATAVISFPVLFVSTVVGTAIALLQAVTQVQEQTLTVLPKFVLVGACIVLGAGFAMKLLAALLQHGVAYMPLVVRTP